MQPVLRKGKGISKIVKDKECPHHKKLLHYEPDTGYWRCREAGCNYRLVPKADVERGSATVDQGPFELFVYKDRDNVRNYLIRSLKSNIVFDITDHVTKVRGVGADTTVEMRFNNIAIKE